MPPTMNPVPALRTCTLRPRRAAPSSFRPVIGAQRPAARRFADDSKKMPEANGKNAVGPNMGQAEHVSEEAAKMANISGGQGPDIEGQGTPVQEILKEDKEARKHAPQVMKDSLKNDQGASNAKPSTDPSGKRSFSTTTRQRQEMETHSSAPEPPPMDLSTFSAAGTETSDLAPKKGHKFPLPTLPIPPSDRKDHRSDTIVEQLTNLMMRDGKKSVAQRNMATILTYLRTAPAPTYNPARPLLPGAPPASHLPLNPVIYLTLAIDSVAPLLRIRSQRGAAGGGVALQIPVPLGLRQRRRQSFQWILDSSSKRANRGSGKDMFAQRVAQELVAIVEGKSGVWEKRGAVHKMATTARSNLRVGRRR